ncbi:MAG TPA: radical SAM protein, partial [Phycisphaerae bacterium]|nr:radical SAM protein [Phycisphaerae bacterium]
RYFRFDDELFTNSQEWLEEFCRRVKEEKLDILFRITGLRVDMISPERLALLKGIGCIAINYGIESGSQAILDTMKKGVTAEQAQNAIRQTLEAGMQVMAYIILGYRGETEQTLRQTAEMLMHCDLPVQYVSIFYAVALPGTKLYRDMLASGLIREEEAYLEQLAVYIEESRPARDYYFVNLSSISFTRLIQWEQILLLLLRAVQLWGAESLRTRFVKACVLGLPTGGIFRRSIQFTNRALDKFLRRSPQRRGWK